MADSYIKILKEANGDITYPQTLASAVHTNNGSDVETEMGKYVTAEEIASTSALTPPVQTNMIADEAVTTAKIADEAVTADKIDWSSIVAATGNKIILGDTMIQWGKQDFPSQSFNNDWYQGHGRGNANNTFDYPTPFSQAVDTLIMIPITAPIQNVQISGTGSGTTSPNLTPVTARQLNQSMTWSAYWIAIGKK